MKKYRVEVYIKDHEPEVLRFADYPLNWGVDSNFLIVITKEKKHIFNKHNILDIVIKEEDAN